jgi:hypothetical protein
MGTFTLPKKGSFRSSLVIKVQKQTKKTARIGVYNAEIVLLGSMLCLLADTISLQAAKQANK